MSEGILRDVRSLLQTTSANVAQPRHELLDNTTFSYKIVLTVVRFLMSFPAQTNVRSCRSVVSLLLIV